MSHLLSATIVLSVPVFRLKSRYMSVALRGSARGTLGTLRRTASLEYFLDCDKECDVEEVELATPPPRPLTSSTQYAKVRREQMEIYPATNIYPTTLPQQYLALIDAKICTAIY